MYNLKTQLQLLLVLLLFSILYRIIPNRPMGFTPQIAMSIFSGAIFTNNKKLALFLPIFSMFISDCIYQIMYINNLTNINGFYDGQLINYILFGALTYFGFGLNFSDTNKILSRTLIAPTIYFLFSNLIVWLTGGGYNRLTLFECYVDGLPFYYNSISATISFGMLLFLTHNFLSQKSIKIKI